jgi:hypothetical protein
VIVENEMRRQVLAELGVSPKRFINLGCVRFTHWWQQRNPDEWTYPKGSKPMVLYLAMNPSRTVPEGIKALQESLKRHAEDFDIVVKIPARRNRKEVFKNFEHPGIRVIGEEVPTPPLINAADCVITTATSVINDAILKEKPILFARFTMPEDTLFSQYGACQRVYAPEGLDYILTNKMWESRQTDDSKYLSDCVYGGYPDETSMLAGYRKLFREIVHG